uniref:Uncharacterized protein n=1 Tax=Mycena chlorophos TaxID=658473 RepID=A0ABQ0LRR4_MYCCL|nr:predicted protein [Mycena chlorophos]
MSPRTTTTLPVSPSQSLLAHTPHSPPASPILHAPSDVLLRLKVRLAILIASFPTADFALGSALLFASSSPTRVCDAENMLLPLPNELIHELSAKLSIWAAH